MEGYLKEENFFSKSPPSHLKLPLPPSIVQRPPRVVLLVQNLLFGGSQRQAVELAGLLNRKQFTVEIWALMAGEDLRPLTERYGVSVRWISQRGSVGPENLWKLWRILKTERPVVLILFTAVPNVWGRLLGRLADVPRIVATVRGGGAPFRQHERWLWRLADHHVCNSENLKDVLTANHGVPRDRITVVRNGVDIDFYRPPDGPRLYGLSVQSPVAVCVARLVPDKDHATLLAAFARVVATLPKARLQIVGNGPLERKLKHQAAELGITGQVSFIPGQLDVRPFLTTANCFVLSSIREGLPNVILEAMAAGLPVAATAVGGVPELVAKEYTGLLTPAGNVTALALALIRLLSDTGLAERYGRAGRAVAIKHFSLKAMAQAYETLLMSLLAA